MTWFGLSFPFPRGYPSNSEVFHISLKPFFCVSMVTQQATMFIMAAILIGGGFLSYFERYVGIIKSCQAGHGDGGYAICGASVLWSDPQQICHFVWIFCSHHALGKTRHLSAHCLKVSYGLSCSSGLRALLTARMCNIWAKVSGEDSFPDQTQILELESGRKVPRRGVGNVDSPPPLQPMCFKACYPHLLFRCC